LSSNREVLDERRYGPIFRRRRHHPVRHPTLDACGLTAAGFSNLLARGAPEQLTVTGHSGWMVTSPSPAETIIGWQVDTPRLAWVTLTILPAIADQADEILAALNPA
jgi:hypothetical protein